MKIKSLLLILVLISTTGISFSQDTIVMRDGTRKIAFVKELTETELKYSSSDNREGPVFILSKYEIEKVNYANGNTLEIEYVKPWFRNKNDQTEIHVETDSLLNKREKDVLSPRLLNPEFLVSDKKLVANYYLLNRKLLKGNKLNKFLSSTNNLKINREVKKIKQYRAIQYACFVGIPLAVGGAYFLLSNEDEKIYDTNMGIGFSSIAGAAVSLSVSFYAKEQRKKHTVLAVDAYNKNEPELKLEPYLLEDKRAAQNKMRAKQPIRVLSGNDFVYLGKLKNQQEIQEIMLRKNDVVIHSKIETARKGKNLRYLVFADIPITIAGFAVLVNALEKGYKEDRLAEQQVISSALLISGALCFTVGIYGGAAYKKNTKKAALRYNRLYQD